jgi:O-antigen ligase
MTSLAGPLYRRTSTRSFPLIQTAFAVGVFLIPFNGFQTLSAFGEFQAEMAFLIFLPLVIASVPTLRPLRSPLMFLFVAIAAAIVFSTLANLEQILSASLRDRSGVNKLVTSMITVIFMFAFAFMVERRLKEPGALVAQIFKPVFYVTLFLLVMSAMQVASWRSGGVATVYNRIIATLRTRYEEQWDTGRIDTVSFEPSILALFLTFSLVLMLGLRPLQPKQQRAFTAFCVIPAVLVVLLFGGARTGLLSVLAILAFHLLFAMVLKRKLPPSLTIIASGGLFLAVHLAVVAYESSVISFILAGDSVSNLSRFAAIIASFNIFLTSPIFGAGLGQYAFRALHLMPSWGWLSPEVVVQFYNPFPSWPPNHSLPMRIASELGSIGVVAYFGILSGLGVAVANKAKREQRRLGAYPIVGHTLLLAYVFVLFSGIAFDSFRQFTVWMSIAAMAAYIRYREPETLFTGLVPARYPGRRAVPIGADEATAGVVRT